MISMNQIKPAGVSAAAAVVFMILLTFAACSVRRPGENTDETQAGEAASFICLSNLGVSNETLSLTGGIAGVVFGIGAQNVVNDILSGILMAFEGVVQVGELVFFNGNIYTVLSVGLRTTKLIWYGETTVVRNNDFKNYKIRPVNQHTRVKVLLRIGMDESLQRIEISQSEDREKQS